MTFIASIEWRGIDILDSWDSTLLMRRFGKFIPLHLEYRRLRKRFGKFTKVKEIGCEGKDKNSL